MVRRPAFTRSEFLVPFAVIALLTGLLARTVQRVHETAAQAEARAPVEYIQPAPQTIPAGHQPSVEGEEGLDLAAQARGPQGGSYWVGFPERRQP
jgi:hypothetical protein